jgi:hypothetical protein
MLVFGDIETTKLVLNIKKDFLAIMKQLAY